MQPPAASRSSTASSAPPCARRRLASSASTTRSSRLTREPLISTRTSRRERRIQCARQFRWHRESARRRRRSCRPPAPPARRSCTAVRRPSARASSPISRWLPSADVAQLGHVAEHQPAPARQLAQHLERGARRTRIGVVGIVDEPGASARALKLQARPSPRASEPGRRPPAPDWRRRWWRRPRPPAH